MLFVAYTDPGNQIFKRHWDWISVEGIMYQSYVYIHWTGKICDGSIIVGI
jgi:hypothetical protein